MSDSRMRIDVCFVGEIDDGGFNACALAGVDTARRRDVAELSVVRGIRYDPEEILGLLERTIPSADGLVFVGGQGNAVVPRLASAYPDKRFAIVQGECRGPNLSSYVVRQEESAYLAGWLAARLTRSGTVAHLSGHRVAPGLAGRAAYADGVRGADAGVELLTGFCGTQDDVSVARTWTAALIERGADIVFTMLNGARPGAIEACRETGTRQIGNALDWVARDASVFVASAIARIDRAVRLAIEDMVDARPADAVHTFGLCDGDYVELSLAAGVPRAVGEEIADVTERLRRRTVDIASSYDGEEFELPPAPAAGT